MMAPIRRGWVDYHAAAFSAGVSVRTIRRWIQRGTLTPKEGLVSLAELDQVKMLRSTGVRCNMQP